METLNEKFSTINRTLNLRDHYWNERLEYISTATEIFSNEIGKLMTSLDHIIKMLSDLQHPQQQQQQSPHMQQRQLTMLTVFDKIKQIKPMVEQTFINGNDISLMHCDTTVALAFPLFRHWEVYLKFRRDHKLHKWSTSMHPGQIQLRRYTKIIFATYAGQHHRAEQ